jgi:hypothetical protein
MRRYRSGRRRSVTDPWLRVANGDTILTFAELRNWSLGIESAYGQLKQHKQSRCLFLRTRDAVSSRSDHPI